jgi:hypothetical protein
MVVPGDRSSSSILLEYDTVWISTFFRNIFGCSRWLGAHPGAHGHGFASEDANPVKELDQAKIE